MENCSLKSTHNTRRYETVLCKTHTIPGGINISFKRSSGEGGILEALCYTRQVGQRRSLTESRPSPGDSREDSSEECNPRVLVLYQEEWGSVDPSGEPSDSREFQVVLRVAQFQGGWQHLVLH